ncbi:unnamed protein product, partial [Prorocentrum cordatum]
KPSSRVAPGRPAMNTAEAMAAYLPVWADAGSGDQDSDSKADGPWEPRSGAGHGRPRPRAATAACAAAAACALLAGAAVGFALLTPAAKGWRPARSAAGAAPLELLVLELDAEGAPGGPLAAEVLEVPSETRAPPRRQKAQDEAAIAEMGLDAEMVAIAQQASPARGSPRPLLELGGPAPPPSRGAAPGPPRALAAEGCRARLRRLGEVAAQRLESPPDLLFPAEASSISGSGGSCGDPASDIHLRGCHYFDRWETLSSIADRRNLPGVVVFGSSVSPGDVAQGQLGDCYFMSALASVAAACPRCIMDMFVHRQREENGIYTTRWLLNGEMVEVSVDPQVPARYGTPFFAQVSNGVFWPLILEKAWAKILGSYHSAEAGNWLSAVGAITRAPVKSLWHSDLLQEELWRELEQASRLGFPIGASTGDGAGDYNLPQSHAYAVFRAYEDPKYGRVVMCFNPWNADMYRGAVPNEDLSDGTFVMKLEEFYHAYRTTQLGFVTDGFTASFQTLQASKQGSALTFSTASNRDFFVSVSWPMRKLVEPCQLTPSVNLALAKQTGTGAWGDVFEGEESKDAAVNMVTARVKGEASTYNIFVGAEFPSDIHLHRVVVIVYASESVHITRSSGSGASELALRMFGPDCNEGHVSFPGHGVFSPSLVSLVHGIPTYVSMDGAEFAYYTPSSHLWFVTSASHWPQVSEGALYYSSRVAASDVRCGCLDSPGGVHGLDTPCSQVLPPHIRYANVMCRGAEYSALVERCCPVTCGACAAAGSAPAPPPPAPAPPPPAPRSRPEAECKDSSPTGIRIRGRSSLAACSELRDACEQSVVRQRCCETCAADVSETAEPECEDERDPHLPYHPRLRLNHKAVTCLEAAGACDNKAVRERCCETCRLQDEKGEQPSVKVSRTA